MPAKRKKIDDFLATVTPRQRIALEKVRRAIRAAAPGAEECISYGLAAFRFNGKPLVAFGATSNHCAFYPMDSTTVGHLTKQLKEFEVSKGTIRFQPEKPLAIALVKKIVRAKLAAIEGKKSPTKPPAQKSDVDEFLAKWNVPLKADYEKVRAIILGVSPKITDGIKWNSLSFRTIEWFATINWRAKETVQLVFHLGAKARNLKNDMKISDPTGLMKWLAKDRCLVSLGTGKAIEKNRKAFITIVKEWIKYV